MVYYLFVVVLLFFVLISHKKKEQVMICGNIFVYTFLIHNFYDTYAKNFFFLLLVNECDSIHHDLFSILHAFCT